MERRMRYKTLQCFLAALTMTAFLHMHPVHRTHMRQAQTLFPKKYIGKTVPGACVVISELQRPSAGLSRGSDMP